MGRPCSQCATTPYKKSTKSKRNAQLSLQKLDIYLYTGTMCRYVYILYILTDVSIEHATGNAAGYQKKDETEASRTAPSLGISAAAPHAFFIVALFLFFYGLIVSYYCPLCFYSRSGFFVVFFTFILISLFILHFVYTQQHKLVVSYFSLSLFFFFVCCCL